MAALNSNYTNQLNAFIEAIQSDKRLTTNHVSLYLALFNIRNQYSYESTFKVIRAQLLRICHINCLSIYHNCLNDLKEFGYIRFFYQSVILGGPCYVSIIPLSPVKDEKIEDMLRSRSNKRKKLHRNRNNRISIKSKISASQPNIIISYFMLMHISEIMEPYQLRRSYRLSAKERIRRLRSLFKS